LICLYVVCYVTFALLRLGPPRCYVLPLPRRYVWLVAFVRFTFVPTRYVADRFVAYVVTVPQPPPRYVPHFYVAFCGYPFVRCRLRTRTHASQFARCLLRAFCAHAFTFTFTATLLRSRLPHRHHAQHRAFTLPDYDCRCGSFWSVRYTAARSVPLILPFTVSHRCVVEFAVAILFMRSFALRSLRCTAARLPPRSPCRCYLPRCCCVLTALQFTLRWNAVPARCLDCARYRTPPTCTVPRYVVALLPHRLYLPRYVTVRCRVSADLPLRSAAFGAGCR